LKAVKNKGDKAIILLSGGIDSAACVHYYLNQNFSIKGLFIDYGQIVKKIEYKSAEKIANHYQIGLDIVKVDIANKFGQGEIKGRNALFVIIALMKYTGFSGIISLGIHVGSNFYDTSEQFMADMNSLLARYTDGTIQINAPFLKWQKPMIYEFCKANNVPIHLTYSCEQGVKKPCGVCNSCLDRKVLNASKK
jgi:7-cyano-7-deazaguanine synthase